MLIRLLVADLSLESKCSLHRLCQLQTLVQHDTKGHVNWFLVCQRKHCFISFIITLESVVVVARKGFHFCSIYFHACILDVYLLACSSILTPCKTVSFSSLLPATINSPSTAPPIVCTNMPIRIGKQRNG